MKQAEDRMFTHDSKNKFIKNEMTYFCNQAQYLHNDVTTNIYFLEESVLRSYYIRKNCRKSVPLPRMKPYQKFIEIYQLAPLQFFSRCFLKNCAVSCDYEV